MFFCHSSEGPDTLIPTRTSKADYWAGGISRWYRANVQNDCPCFVLLVSSLNSFCWPCYLSVRNQSAFGGFHLVNMHECFCKIRMSACSVFATIVQHGWHRRCYLCSKNLMILAKGCSLHEHVFCHSSKVHPSFCCPWIRIPEAEERETVRAQWYETDVYFLPVVQHVYVLMEKWIPVKMFCNAFFWMEQHVATHSLLHYDSIFWALFVVVCLYFVDKHLNFSPCIKNPMDILSILVLLFFFYIFRTVAPTFITRWT